MYRKDVSGSISSSFNIKKYNDLFNSLTKGVVLAKEKWEGEAQDALLSFWAYEYCILTGMAFYAPKSERKSLQKTLYEYDWLMQYQMNPKVGKVATLRKLIGKRLSRYCLYMYLRTMLK